MNNGITWKQYWLTIEMDLQMISRKQCFTYSLKICWMMNNLEFLWIYLTLQHRNWYYCTQAEEQKKHLSHVNLWRVSFAQWNLLLHMSNRIGALHSPQGRTFHSVFRTWTPSLSAGTAIDKIFKSLWGNQLKTVVVDEVSMLSAQFLVLLDTRLRSMYNSDQTFGCISILLIGDFIQLPLTTGHDLWSVMYGIVSGNNGTAGNLFEQFVWEGVDS